MNAPDYAQIIDGLGQGVVVLDAESRVQYWNRWMERASGLPADAVAGKPITELYPGMDSPSFRRNLRSVLGFGIQAYFSQLLHGALFPFPAAPGSPEGYAEMQQHCVMGPIRRDGKIALAYIIVQDVTETVSLQRRLADLALRDGLTQVFNRRYLDRRLVEELDRARRYSHNLSLAMVDIDHFKAVNDTFGHQFGDEALKLVAGICQGAIRASDTLSRYGGEEFCLLLPETGIEDATRLAERIRRTVQGADVEALGRNAKLTVSMGLSAAIRSDDPDSLVKRADRALYKAKTDGRNRIEVSA